MRKAQRGARPVGAPPRRLRRAARRQVAVGVIVALAAAACSSGAPPDDRGAASAAPSAVVQRDDASAPAPGPAAGPAGTSTPVPVEGVGVLAQDLTQQPVDPPTDGQGLAVPAGPSGCGAPAAPGADPLAVAAGYLTARLTYRYDDPAGYTAALTAQAWTTPAFAARSDPGPADLSRLQTAQESSSVQVGQAVLQDDAPDTATTCYVTVAFTATSTYRGPGSGTPQPGTWTLRLVQTASGVWRVDGVPATS